jgi:hypothetical protein
MHDWDDEAATLEKDEEILPNDGRLLEDFTKIAIHSRKYTSHQKLPSAISRYTKPVPAPLLHGGGLSAICVALCSQKVWLSET